LSGQVGDLSHQKDANGNLSETIDGANLAASLQVDTKSDYDQITYSYELFAYDNGTTDLDAQGNAPGYVGLENENAWANFNSIAWI
jgi:hypothetical protein